MVAQLTLFKKGCIVFEIIEKNDVMAENRQRFIFLGRPLLEFTEMDFFPKNLSFGMDCFRFCWSDFDQKKILLLNSSNQLIFMFNDYRP